MKKVHLLKLTTFILLGFSLSCVNDASQDNEISQDPDFTEFTINQAQTIFESIIEDCVDRYSQTNYSSDKLFPGDYIPDWSNATKMQVGNLTTIVCPILSSRHIIALGACYRNNKSNPFTVEIKQFLVFESCGSDTMVHIVLRNMIMDSQLSSWDSNRSNIYPHGELFSGMICDYNLTGKLVKVQQVTKGIVVNPNKEMNISKYLRSIGIFKIVNIIDKDKTRSFGEDDWDDWDDYDDDYDYDYDDDDDWDDDNLNWIYEQYPETNPDYIPDINGDDYGGGNDDNYDQEFDCVIPLRHQKCGTILGYVLWSEFDNCVRYCPTCKKNVYFYM